MELWMLPYPPVIQGQDTLVPLSQEDNLIKFVSLLGKRLWAKDFTASGRLTRGTGRKVDHEDHLLNHPAAGARRQSAGEGLGNRRQEGRQGCRKGLGCAVSETLGTTDLAKAKAKAAKGRRDPRDLPGAEGRSVHLQVHRSQGVLRELLA